MLYMWIQTSCQIIFLVSIVRGYDLKSEFVVCREPGVANCSLLPQPIGSFMGRHSIIVPWLGTLDLQEIAEDFFKNSENKQGVGKGIITYDPISFINFWGILKKKFHRKEKLCTLQLWKPLPFILFYNSET